MYQHLFAIVGRLPVSWRPPESVLGRVELRAVDGFDVISSGCERAPAANARTLADHEVVVAAAMDADALLPFRFGTVVPAIELDAWLAAHAARIRATLAEVRGSVEVNVKLLRLSRGRGAARARPDAAEEVPGTVELRRLADRLIESAGLGRWRFRASAIGENVAGSVAFLVARDEVATFLSRIAPVASRAGEIAVVPTGPWPAYSFVGSFERLPLAHAPAAPRRADRLTGACATPSMTSGSGTRFPGPATPCPPVPLWDRLGSVPRRSS